jgi:thiosulfate/3-mercaptopyruvate sulfurtransferase
MSDATFLISTDWLQYNLLTPNQRIVDCSWYVPEMNRSGRAAFAAQHIPGAVYFDLDDISDKHTKVVNMLPDAETFAAKVGALGIGNDTRVVVYDKNYVSARVWWMFRCMGHHNVCILDGGFTKWLAEGRPVVNGPAQVEPRRFSAHLNPNQLADWKAVLENIGTGAAQLLDARTAARFKGEQATGYPGITNGRIPGSVNLPWADLYNGDKTFLAAAPLRARLAAAGVDFNRPVISTCGSGVTACIIGLSLSRLGHENWRVYDGSWHEWAQRGDLPRES